ncbi:DUF222 domain-containing protein [Cellulomonas sp.]|uniref:HNH endonuclease signature motif containing protein n=1 Tax=Cellulomonas sp. TaxID=40001 RepID=UPI001B031A39|nr:DUF222 domain-containing protein [Cellulomonas sp.]MBO9556092.1 DUF222 domain-containing protein [Cellulomonas sp.]
MDVDALLRAAEQLATTARQANRWAADQRRSALGTLERVVALVTAARSQILVAERAAESWSGRGDRSFESWHARTSHTGVREATHQVRQADALASLPRVAEAVVTGGMSAPHLDVVARAAATGSPTVASRIRSDDGQAQLVAMAEKLDADAYGRAVARWAAKVDPGRLERTHQQQRAERFLHVTETPGGTHVKGLLDQVAGHRLRLALEAASPRPAADDDRSSEQRRADALAAIADTVLGLPETTPGAAVRPHVSVVLREETWVALRAARPSAAKPRGVTEPVPAVEAIRGVEPPTDEDGAPLPASEVARILCDCELTRIVVDAQDQPVDLGRTARLYSGAQRRAVLVRDGGCGWPGCGARARWCEVHHIAWWDRDGGPTSIDNAIALCSFHHHEVHRQDLRITRRPLAPPRQGPVRAPASRASRDSSTDPGGTASRGSPRRGSTRASDPTGPPTRASDPVGPLTRASDPTGPPTRASDHTDPTGPPGQRYAFRRPDGRLVAPLTAEPRGAPLTAERRGAP